MLSEREPIEDEMTITPDSSTTGAEQSSTTTATALTMDTDLPSTDVNPSEESIIPSSQFITKESIDHEEELEVSSSATITILALVTAPPPTPTVRDSTSKNNEIPTTISIPSRSVILEETEVHNKPAVVTFPDATADPATPSTAPPQLEQEVSLDALTTPDMDSGSHTHWPGLCFSLVSIPLVTLLVFLH
uniref:Uncharacterized protein n=1 Tax=Anopheles maculatus TaxID=74869 RepID=A0A182SVR8_9DIPT